MLHIKYTSPCDLELSGSPGDLLNLRDEIVSFTIHPGVDGLTVQADASADPSPYACCLAQLRIQRAIHPARLAVDGGTLVLAGTPDTLALFCTFLESAAQDGHAHYEYYEGSEYISADSIPLVVCGR